MKKRKKLNSAIAMNKLRLLIVSEQNEFDKKLSSKIKKFSSERNLFFTNLYNNSINMNNSSNSNLNSNNGEKSIEKSNKSFFRNTIIKRCKSSKDVSQSTIIENCEKPRGTCDGDEKFQRQSFNLDEFDRSYLFSQNRKNIVKELRKNFENQNDSSYQQRMTRSPISEKPPAGTRKIPTSFRKCEFSAPDLEKRLSLREKSVNDFPQKRTIMRHSFYLHRNEYDDSYEVGDNCNDCTRVKNKARQLIEMFGRNELPLRPPLKNGGVQAHDHHRRMECNNNINNNSYYIVTNNNNNNEYNMINQNSIHKPNLDAIFITRNNLLNSSQQKRRSLNAAIARDKNLYRNLLSDSFEDSKFGIKKSGSVNKIDLEILKSELDDYVDPKWRSSIGLGYGFRSQRTLRTNRKELDLEQKIDLEIKMREGSAKLLAACNNPKSASSGLSSSSNGGHCAHNTQMLEAAKNLLTSNERMTSYMAELQRRKQDRDTIAKAKPYGKVSFSEIRMPLMWRDTDHFKNKGDHRRFAVFCLAKIGTEIYDTSLLCPVDRNLTDVCFNDAILFTKVTPDFSLKLEVYAVMMESDLSIASTPRKIKNTIHSSISRTVGRRLAANLKDELNNTKIGPKFELIATAHLSLDDASESAHTHDLCLTPNNAKTVNINNKLPLFGHFCCRLAVQPDFYDQAMVIGPLDMLSKGPARHVEGYARLQAFRVDLWDDEKSFQANYQPRRSIDVTRETKCKLRNECDIVVVNLEEGNIEEYIFHASSPNEAQKWYTAIKKAIKEHSQWGHITLATEPMQVAIPGNSKTFLTRNPRQGSLYDQVPILESIESRQSSRPTVHDIFLPIPPSGDTSPTDFRSRSYSSGRSSSHSSSTLSAGSVGSINSRKSHWPFSNK